MAKRMHQLSGTQTLVFCSVNENYVQYHQGGGGGSVGLIYPHLILNCSLCNPYSQIAIDLQLLDISREERWLCTADYEWGCWFTLYNHQRHLKEEEIDII